MTSETWHTAIDEHEVIVRLLSARDGAKLGELLRRHVHSAWEQLAPEADVWNAGNIDMAAGLESSSSGQALELCRHRTSIASDSLSI